MTSNMKLTFPYSGACGATCWNTTTPEIAPNRENTRSAQSAAKKGMSGTNVKTENKRCINCNGNHSALAMKCAKKKEVLKEKRKEEAEKNKQTYAAPTAVLQTNNKHTTHHI